MMRPMTNPAAESAPDAAADTDAGITADIDGGPLAHLRVLDLSRLHPGAFVTSLLADFGADVLRIEQPGGTDPLRYDRAMNVAYNRGKRSMTLDLRHERAGDVLRRLVRNVDVLIESARPAPWKRGVSATPISRRRTPAWSGARSLGSGAGAPTPIARRTT